MTNIQQLVVQFNFFLKKKQMKNTNKKILIGSALVVALAFLLRKQLFKKNTENTNGENTENTNGLNDNVTSGNRQLIIARNKALEECGESFVYSGTLYRYDAVSSEFIKET